MGIRLVENNYGKLRVRLLRVARQGGRHDVKELTLAIRFEGDFESAHTQGDNRKILPTDTIKNTVYALARQHPIETAEEFCLHLADHFLTYNPQISRVRIEGYEDLWNRLPHGGKAHASAFTRSESERRTVTLNGTREKLELRAGIENLMVLKTTPSSFDNFLRDSFTAAKEDQNPILSTAITASWLYTGDELQFAPLRHGIRQTLLEAFVEHKGRSLQDTLFAMGEAVLSNFDNVHEIHLSLPNRQCVAVDLSPLGMDNPDEVFLPADEPHAVIEATLSKT